MVWPVVTAQVVLRADLLRGLTPYLVEFDLLGDEDPGYGQQAGSVSTVRVDRVGAFVDGDSFVTVVNQAQLLFGPLDLFAFSDWDDPLGTLGVELGEGVTGGLFGGVELRPQVLYAVHGVPLRVVPVRPVLPSARA
ncbi:hypothetical protein GCM10022226_78660 [Sphaerisporangium flaviroseum]|uniref:Uncharacterized protein n=1 Tax=Sphaerisporangium flaviroseum TaxID=509199 RepID=A0ABP7JG89_9ACTN